MQEIQVSEVEVQKLTKFADTEGQVDTSLHLQSLQPRIQCIINGPV